MARRRMFNLELISSDRFLGMKASAQAFYFHLNMHADDEGFVSAPRSLGMLCGGSNEDLDQLEQQGFVIRFASGVLVITHWLLNNTIRKDRSMQTIHRAEKAMLSLVDNCYVRTEDIKTEQELHGQAVTTNLATKTQTVFSDESAPQNRIEQNRKEYIRIDNNRSDYPGGENADPVDDGDGTDASTIEKKGPSCMDVQSFAEQEGLQHVDAIQFWSHYYLNDWRDQNGQPIRDWKALLRSCNQAAIWQNPEAFASGL